MAALDHPGAFSALTLVGTRAVAPGPPDDDLPDHDRTVTRRLFARPMPDGTDREAVAEFAADGAEILGDDPVAARAIAARIWDRTPGTAPPIQMANQMGTVFSRLDCAPRRREHLPGLEVPTLVVHGRRDRFFPVGDGEAIAREIPGARLLVLEGAATAIPVRQFAKSPRGCSRSDRGRRCSRSGFRIVRSGRSAPCGAPEGDS
ncbi:alpha/beta hydrolase [Streptomyces bikiniensis]|uniref:alpha/beta hydrolase n=1 Tax=Streptomyces bikiniensis TaxID=1896 RepID=UPI001F4114BA|nr:alpha/beta hydrolase [Streptomyces bikiniensis]